MSNSGEGFNNVSPSLRSFVMNDQSEKDDKREESPSSQVSSMSIGKTFNVENEFIALDTSTLAMQSVRKKLWNCDSTGDNSLFDQESLLEQSDMYTMKKLSESDYMAIDEYVNFDSTGENRPSSMTKIISTSQSRATSPTIAIQSTNIDDSPIGHSYEIFEAIGQKKLEQDITLQMNATKNRSNQKIEVLRSSFNSKMTRYFTWVLIVGLVIHLSSILWFKTRDGKKMVLKPLQQQQQFPLKECTATESFCSFSVKEERESLQNTSLLGKDTHAIDDPAPKQSEQATEIQNRTLPAYVIPASITSMVNMTIQKDHEIPMIKRKITSFILHLCNLFILMAVAMIYALLPRRLNISRCEYWNRQTLLELCNSCRKRGLPCTGILRNDMIRNLCEYEGITNSFPRLDTSNYSSLSKIELKNTLKKLGVATSGVKMDLQYRLVLTRENMFLTWHREELMRLIISSGLKVDVLMDNKEAMARKLAEAGPWLLPNLKNQ